MLKKKREANNTFHTSEVIFLIVITCIVSLFMGSVISYQSKPFLKTDAENEWLNNLLEHYHHIKENYYEEVDDSILLEGAIAGMVGALDDPYSIFINGDASENFDINLDGNYSGVGIEITNNIDNDIQIVGVFASSPAAQAGVQVGDIVVAIDGISMIGEEKSALTEYVKQNKLDTFTLTLRRGGEEIQVEVTKTTVEIPSVSSRIFEANGKKVGYIYFSIFSNTTHTQFQKELSALEEQHIDSLVIDVRENAGGHLTTAIEIASLFLDKTKVIYQIELKGETTKYYAKGKETKQYPIVVLQNHNSASASELLSGALKESYGATIIGETSYGKGTVQELVKLTDNSEYKFTTKKWLTPEGNWVHQKGIAPDIEVILQEEYYRNPIVENDNQLQEAIDYLTK